MVRMRRSDRHAIRDWQTTFPSPDPQTTRMRPSLPWQKPPSGIHKAVARYHRGWRSQTGIPTLWFLQRGRPLYQRRGQQVMAPEAASAPVAVRVAAVQIPVWAALGWPLVLWPARAPAHKSQVRHARAAFAEEEAALPVSPW